MKIRYLLPLLLFMLIASILWRGLKLHPGQIPSPLIHKHAPTFDLPDLLTSAHLTNKDLQGHVSLLNVWATWCQACAQEHDFLVELAKNNALPWYGLNYKDDAIAAKNWLRDHGNPYQLVAVDHTGDVAIDWGVYGAPETFVIDKHGIVRYKQIGPITAAVWEQELKPVIDRLQGEA
ncbi:MAG: DsbE family thiol:disulfide interchange protein [Pseudomonadota bacterium]